MNDENSMALMYAAEDGDVDTVSQLLASPEPITDEWKWKILSVAVVTGQAEALQLLIEDSRFSWNENSEYFHLMNDAIAYFGGEHERVLRTLMRHPDVAARTWAFTNALTWAARYWSIDIFQSMLSTPPPFSPAYEVMLAAIQARNVRAIELLLADGRCPLQEDILRSAAQTTSIAVVRAVLRDPRAVAPAIIQSALQCLHELKIDVASIIARHPAVDPSFNDNVALKSAARENREDLVYLLLGDERVRDTGNEAIRAAAQNLVSDQKPIIRLLLASWPDQNDRERAAEAAREVATPSNRAYIDELMSNDVQRLALLNAFLPLQLDRQVSEELVDCAYLQDLRPETVLKLHRIGWLTPIVDGAFGRSLATSFNAVFNENFARLARFSRVSAIMPNFSVGSTDSSSGNLQIGDAMPNVVRQMTNGMSERAADLLWDEVNLLNRQAARSQKPTPVRERKSKLLNSANGFRETLAGECVYRLQTAAQALPRESDRRNDAEMTATLAKYRLARIEVLSNELSTMLSDADPDVARSAEELLKALNDFVSAIGSGEDGVSHGLRNDLTTKLAQFQTSLATEGRRFDDDTTLLAAVEELAALPAQELMETKRHIHSTARSRDVDLQM